MVCSIVEQLRQKKSNKIFDVPSPSPVIFEAGWTQVIKPLY